MRYLIQNLTNHPKILLNLHKSCKYFFVIQSNPVCNRLCIQDSRAYWKGIEYYGQSLGIHTSNQLEFKHKLILANAFDFHHFTPFYLSRMGLPNIIQCHAKFIHISKQTFNFKEFKVLVGHGNVECLHFETVKITKNNDDLLVLEEILLMVPKIIEFEYDEPILTPETFSRISECSFHNKIKIFKLLTTDLFNPFDFLAFLKKNFIPYFYLHIVFKVGQNTIEFKNIVNNEIQQYWPTLEKPFICLH